MFPSKHEFHLVDSFRCVSVVCVGLFLIDHRHTVAQWAASALPSAQIADDGAVGVFFSCEFNIILCSTCIQIIQINISSLIE